MFRVGRRLPNMEEPEIITTTVHLNRRFRGDRIIRRRSGDAHRHLDRSLRRMSAQLVSRDREKLANAILYFHRHTENLTVEKLYRLLYLLDFEHFRQTGQSVTGMEYVARESGPVPERLDRMIRERAG